MLCLPFNSHFSILNVNPFSSVSGLIMFSSPCHHKSPRPIGLSLHSK